MPIFSPKPFQLPYLPVTPPDIFFEEAFCSLERTGKGLLFGCRMCGNCILQETAFVCPMTCAKGLRNGFCGEATEEGCVVDKRRPCTWLQIYKRSEQMGRSNKLLENNAPIDGAHAGHSAWLPFVKFWSKKGQPVLTDLVSNSAKFWSEWEELCLQFRQPDWWQGDSAYHPPSYQEPISHLETALRTHKFIVTGEIEPPMDNATSQLVEKVKLLRKYLASINFSDNAFATGRLSSLACAKLCLEAGGESVMQMQGRDRSRNGILSDVMGASAMGVHNILCLGGDYHNKGPQVYPVQPHQFDIDGVQMIWMLRRLRDEGRHVDGREVETRPNYFIGAAGAPFTLRPDYSALRMEKKVNAGAQFIQTQMIFDVNKFYDWLEACNKRGILNKTYILAGVYPLKDVDDAHFMATEPGITIPDEVIKRMEAAAEKDGHVGGEKSHQRETSLEISAEIIHALQKIGEIKGVHLMVGGQEEIVPEVFEAAGLQS
jgi:methylenetetrahydrofolate reductase (NADPH)